MSAPNNKTWIIRPFGDVTAQQAQDQCRLQGGDLLSINSAEEQQAFAAAFRQAFGGLDKALWLGVFAPRDANRSDASSWHWLSSGGQVAYANWGSLEPYDWSQFPECQTTPPEDYCPAPGAPMCAITSSGDDYFYWYTSPCDPNTPSHKRPTGVACQIGELLVPHRYA